MFLNLGANVAMLKFFQNPMRSYLKVCIYVCKYAYVTWKLKKES